MRWFYDENLQRSRIDTVVHFNGEPWILNSINDFSAGIQWDILLQDGTAQCFDNMNLTHHMPIPDFSKFEYIGTSIYFFEEVLMWGHKEGDVSLVYYEQNATGMPARFDMHDRRKSFTATVDFIEFDRSSQDAHLFEIPQVLKNICNEIKN